MKSATLNQFLHHDLKTKTAHEEQCSAVMTSILDGTLPHHEISEIPIQYLDMSRLPGVPEHNILTPSKAYRPFRYDFAYPVWEQQNQTHWMHTEIKLDQDLQDWKTKMTDEERNLASHIFPLFVQNDVLVNNVYITQYARIFKPVEIQLAISAIINMESIHEVSYSHLLTELGFSDKQYSVFMEYKEMMDKYDFTAGFKMDTLVGIAVAMLVFGAFTEGLQLFGAFIMLFNFQRFGKLKGMGQVVAFSVRDESAHVNFVAHLYNHFMREFGHLIDRERLEEAAYNAVRTIVENEHRFIDLAFELGPVEGMAPEEVKQYICAIADMRLQQFGLAPIYNVEQPFEWADSMMGGVEHANFFETRASAYSKGATRGTWEEAFN